MTNIFRHQENQIKITLRVYLIPFRMAEMKNTNYSLCWCWCETRENPLPLLVELPTSTANIQTNTAVSKKTENKSASSPSYTTLRHIPKGFSILSQRYFLNYVHCYFFIIAKNWKQLRCPSVKECIKICGKYTIGVLLSF